MNVRKIILEEFNRQQTLPHVWGTNDCLCYAAAIAQRIIGRDPIAHLRGRYDSEIGAKRVMIEEGWETLGDVAASIFPEIPVAQAQPGDWVYARNPDDTETIGVAVGERFVAKGQIGNEQGPLLYARRAFRVGGSVNDSNVMAAA
jgi:hypothetical protein